jgi:hypothetical protein
MKMSSVRKISVALTAICSFALACAKSDQPATQNQTASPEIPMQGPMQIPISLVSNYAFMGQMFSKGDGLSFAKFYVDTATIVIKGYQSLQGRFAIRDFVRSGDEWGVREMGRLSKGFRVDGRDVIDSGSYGLVAVQVPARTLDPRGRYWTWWTYTPQGEWVIKLDSLVGINK